MAYTYVKSKEAENPEEDDFEDSDETDEEEKPVKSKSKSNKVWLWVLGIIIGLALIVYLWPIYLVGFIVWLIFRARKKRHK